jgi:hypothetical protein
VFAGTYTNGVFASGDNGATWRPISEGLSDQSVASHAVEGSYLFALTSSGVWKRPLTEIVSITSGQGDLPQRFVLEQNYPNPFNPSTTIQYAFPRRSHVMLSVYNTLGQLVTTLVNSEEQSGYHEVKFDASNLASGVYFYRLQAGSFVKTMKCLLIR